MELNKDLLKKAFDAGAAHAIGSYTDFEQIHPDFDRWYEENLKDRKAKATQSYREWCRERGEFP